MMSNVVHITLLLLYFAKKTQTSVFLMQKYCNSVGAILDEKKNLLTINPKVLCQTLKVSYK